MNETVINILDCLCKNGYAKYDAILTTSNRMTRKTASIQPNTANYWQKICDVCMNNSNYYLKQC